MSDTDDRAFAGWIGILILIILGCVLYLFGLESMIKVIFVGAVLLLMITFTALMG